MNRLAIVLLLLALLVSLSLAGCQSPLKASGELKTEDFNFTDFSHVQANGPFNIEIIRGDAYRVSITADDNIFEKIEITSEESILKLEMERSRFLGISRTQYVDATVKAVITMPYVRGLALGGQGGNRYHRKGAAGVIANY